MINLAFVDLNDARQHQVRYDLLLHIVRKCLTKEMEVLRATSRHTSGPLVKHSGGSNSARVHHPQGQRRVELAHVHV